MSIFDELVEELKEENLLEETVLDLRRASTEPYSDRSLTSQQVLPVGDVPASELFDAASTEVSHAASQVPNSSQDFFRKQAMEEVSTLQMVEHVLSGIEREHMKLAPKTYDDLGVKKALHRFMQVGAASDAAESSEAQSAFYSEAQNWSTSLSDRDRDISVANLRRYCENSRPVLSSQALIALARFFRNAPFSEAVRGKFDFVMTRLFSRDIGDEKRKLIFPESEILGHISTLYSNWSSLSVREVDDDRSKVDEMVKTFRGFIAEAETSEKFDDLIRSDFFNRIRLFKEQTNESFFLPTVVASAIECNVRIGNRFVELIKTEQSANTEGLLEERYGFAYDIIISNAAGKTLLLQDLLNDEAPEIDINPQAESPAPATPPQVKFERTPADELSRWSLLAVNKWLVAVTVLVIAACGGIFLWPETAANASKGIDISPAFEISDPDLKAHLRDASTNNETLYAETATTWDALSEDEQKQFLSKTYAFAKGKGMRKVSFLNARGKTVAFASEARLDIYGP